MFPFVESPSENASWISCSECKRLISWLSPYRLRSPADLKCLAAAALSRLLEHCLITVTEVWRTDACRRSSALPDLADVQSVILAIEQFVTSLNLRATYKIEDC